MASVKEILRLVAPPILLKLATCSRRGRLVEWEYVPEGWAYAREHPEVRGWNVEEILQVYKDKWPKFRTMVTGTGPLGVAHESDLRTDTNVISHNIVMSFGYVLALAARGQDSLSVLDWGGGIGHYCLFAEALLPEVQVNYHCKDLPLLAEYGAQLFPQQRFYSDESCLERSYDLVMASTSLHYTENWQELCGRLAQSTRRYFYIANLPSVLHASSFVFIQRPYAYHYNTEYLSWCLNRDELLRAARVNSLSLVREFVYGLAPDIVGAPEQNHYRGFLFRPAYERPA